MLEWNVKAMFGYFDGTANLFEVLSFAHPRAGLRMATVSVWNNRARISAKWLPVVVGELISRGMALEAMFSEGKEDTQDDDQLEQTLDDVGL